MTLGAGRTGPLVILLGAASWPAWPSLDNPAFGGSCASFARYVREMLGVSAGDILNLFDSPDTPPELVDRIQRFLRRADGDEPRDVLVYYVGHAGWIPDDRRLALFTACAASGGPDSSSFHTSYLEEATRDSGRHRRTYLIIDACFAAGAADAFKEFAASAGVAVLASAGRGDTSSAPQGATVTTFNDLLMTVLGRGDPGLGERLTLRDVHLLIEDERAARDDKRMTAPELHVPRQRRGDIANEEVFPNAAHPTRRRAAARSGGRPWCAVVSDADGHGPPAGAFVDALHGFRDRFRMKIENETGWRLRENPTVVRAGEVFASPRALREAVAAVCSADLAFFDFTGLEPAVMVLLGLRAVIRRGVTICTAAEDPVGDRSGAPPFLLRDINLMHHGARTADPERSFGERALEGIRELIRSPYRYCDLPAFDTIRHMPPTSTDGTVIPYYERVLVLCPFDADYNGRVWPHVERLLRGAVSNRRSIDVPKATVGEVRIERTLDMDSPRVVSANLLEAIRLTELCICDLTGWKPNVLFELGLRLAAHRLGPVCVAADAPGLELDQEEHVIAQRKQLKTILDVVEFDPTQREDYYPIIDRHRRFQNMRDQATHVPGDPAHIPVGSVYNLAWQFADSAHEPSAVKVIDLLRSSAAELSMDRSRGRLPFIFPVSHAMTVDARINAGERLIAAWLFLRHRWPDNNALTTEALDALRNVGAELADLLKDSPRADDRSFADQVGAQLEEIERSLRRPSCES